MNGIAKGFTRKQICSALGIALGTMKTYRANALFNTGATNNIELTHYAIREGITDLMEFDD